MQIALVIIFMALAAFATASPAQQGRKFAKLKRFANDSTPVSLDQITALYTATSIPTDIIKPLPTLAPFTGTPVGITHLPAITESAQATATNYQGVNAQLPSISNVSPNPETITPFNQSATARRDIFGRQCDPAIYCCPDPRHLIEDSGYPWSTVGRISTKSPSGGTQSCAATWIGRRLILTASHCVNWHKESNGLLPAISFQPNYWDGKAGAPTYYVTYVRGGPGTEQGDPSSQEGIGSDFVVMVVDVPQGFDTSYLGSITYNTDWNNLDVWTHIGYPGKFSPAGTLPYIESPFSVIDAYHPGYFHSEHGYAIKVAACFSPGDSGGPLFATFTKGPCVGVCVIGVVSGNDCLGIADDNFTRRCGNYAAGGSDMVNLIRNMRKDYP